MTPPATDVLLVGGRLRPVLARAADMGLSAACVESCLEAIRILATTSSGVVVVPAEDIRGNERSAIRALKTAAGRPAVIVTLPLDDGLTRKEVALAGADAALESPCWPGQVLKRVSELLESRRSWQSAGLALPHPTPMLGLKTITDLVSDLGRLAKASDSMKKLLQTLVSVFADRVRARRASLLLPQRGKQALRLASSVGLPEDALPLPPIPFGKGISGRVAASRQPILVADLWVGPYRALARREGYRTPSCLCFPVLEAERLLAVLNLADKDDGAPFTERDLQVVETLSAQAAPLLSLAGKLRRSRALSVIDDLTTLYNRRHFRRVATKEFRRAQRYGHPLTVSILDVDHFKLYNDQNGHEEGNRALRKIAQILKSSFRTSDTVCRYGGEEFVVILPETEKGMSFVPEARDSQFGAFRFLDRVRTRIESAQFTNEASLPGGKLTISGGVASYPTDAETLDELIEAADRSLYLAKAEGRNRVHIAE